MSSSVKQSESQCWLLWGKKGEDSDEVCSLVREAKDEACLPWDIVVLSQDIVLP